MADVESQQCTDEKEDDHLTYKRVRVGDLGTVEIFDGVDNSASGDDGDHDEDTGSVNTIDENYDVVSITSSIEDPLTWRGRMQAALHHKIFHLIIILLVVLDVIIVLFELFLDVGAFNTHVSRACPIAGNFLEEIEFCHFDQESRNICAPPAHLVLKNRFLMSDFNQTDCKCDFREGRKVCIPKKDEEGTNPAFILHCLSLAILTFFMLEIILKLVAFRLKYFIQYFEVFDGIIVVISWMVDVASLIDEETFEATTLIIILRLWRVIRVINGAILTSKAQSETKFHRVKTDAKKSIHALHKAKAKLDEVQRDNEELRNLLKQGTMETKKEPDNKTGLDLEKALEPDTTTKKEPDKTDLDEQKD